MRLLAFGFHGVETDCMAPLPFTLANEDLFDLQVLRYLAVAARPGQDGLGDLVSIKVGLHFLTKLRAISSGS